MTFLLDAIRDMVGRRSGGIRVRGRVANAIRYGNRARDRHDWNNAAALYRAAVDRDPTLSHIWVQLGHALRETGDLDAAIDAYRAASIASPKQSEPLWWLGETLRATGAIDEAVESEISAMRLGPPGAAKVARIYSNLSITRSEHRRFVEEVSRLHAPDHSPEPPTYSERARVYTDVGDILQFFLKARLPSGIQRVQSELGRAMANEEGPGYALCCFSPAAREWIEVPKNYFRDLIELSIADDDVFDKIWERDIVRIHQTIASSAPIAFTAGSVLLNLGTGAFQNEYLPSVRAKKSSAGIRYAAFAYDIIPLVLPDDVPRHLVMSSEKWVRETTLLADQIIAISECTRRDILKYTGDLGLPFSDKNITVSKLDCSFHSNTTLEPTSCKDEASRKRFAIFVSTIEPRKNHRNLFDAWSILVQRHGDLVPNLLCIGRVGWQGESIAKSLQARTNLTDKIQILSGISDLRLRHLYDDCEFTLYPSMYEGWGLPVTESLCHGKVPVISGTSSLPEAGGEFAIYFDPSSPMSIAEAVEPLILAPENRLMREQRIRENFSPRLWSDLAEEISSLMESIMLLDR